MSTSNRWRTRHANAQEYELAVAWAQQVAEETLKYGPEPGNEGPSCAALIVLEIHEKGVVERRKYGPGGVFPK